MDIATKNDKDGYLVPVSQPDMSCEVHSRNIFTVWSEDPLTNAYMVST